MGPFGDIKGWYLLAFMKVTSGWLINTTSKSWRNMTKYQHTLLALVGFVGFRSFTWTGSDLIRSFSKPSTYRRVKRAPSAKACRLQIAMDTSGKRANVWCRENSRKQQQLECASSIPNLQDGENGRDEDVVSHDENGLGDYTFGWKSHLTSGKRWHNYGKSPCY